MRTLLFAVGLVFFSSTAAHSKPVPAEKVAQLYGVNDYRGGQFHEGNAVTYSCLFHGTRGAPTFESFGPLYGAIGRMPIDVSYPPQKLWIEWVRATYSLEATEFVARCEQWSGRSDAAAQASAAESWIRNYSNFEVVMATGFELDWSISRPAFQRWLDRVKGESAKPKLARSEKSDEGGSPRSPDLASADAEASRLGEDRAAVAVEERARLEQEEARARAESEKKSQEAVDALYAQQVQQTQDYLRAEEEKIALIERQQREADARAAAFERLLAHQRRTDAEYEASMTRHRKCVDGDAKACEDIRQGVPVKLSESDEKASTDDDATRCVTPPVVSPSTEYRGQTQAVVVNGCDKPVDVRVCLLREGGWNCGVNWGIRPQDKWSHTTFKALGGVFWDARYSGTTKALGNPE